MFNILFLLGTSLLTAATETLETTGNTHTTLEKNGVVNIAVSTNNQTMPTNYTYIDRAENMLRLPLISKYDDHKNRKKLKKSPKRTIQKIIKKHRNKSKNIYVYKVTALPTPQPKHEDSDLYAQDEYQKHEDAPTTVQNQRKKVRKWNTKVARYPMPFHKLQSRRDRKERTKRNIDKDEQYVLEDFDEIKFLNTEKDYNVIEAHVKKYW